MTMTIVVLGSSTHTYGVCMVTSRAVIKIYKYIYLRIKIDIENPFIYSPKSEWFDNYLFLSWIAELVFC